MKPVLAVATIDTKNVEIAFIADLIRSTGVPCHIVDVGGTDNHPSNIVKPNVSRSTVLTCHPNQEALETALNRNDRGSYVTMMSEALVAYVSKEKDNIGGIIGIGGSGGTALITPAMKVLSLGVPKVMVSTMASGDVGPYVGGCDITMMYSVADVAGLNEILRKVLANAAFAISGMAKFAGKGIPGGAAGEEEKVPVGMTMFGVTTPCCDGIRSNMEKSNLGMEALCFHATGSGGRAMEKLVSDGLLRGVLDVTTTEVADELFGGVLSAGPERMDYLSKNGGVPTVMSVGACDMVNFGNVTTVPPKFQDRNLLVHNPEVTLMRTTPEENKKIAEFIAKKVNKSIQPFVLLLPEGGVSIVDAPGMPFHDPDADKVLFDSLESLVDQNENRLVVRVPHAINDQAFADIAVKHFCELMTKAGTTVERASTEEAATTETSRLVVPKFINGPTPGPRDKIIPQLLEVIQSGKPIIGAGAGTGISAKFEAAGGADLIIVYNSGRFRMSGHGSLAGLLPFKDANAVMLEMGEEILPLLKHKTPMLAGVCATDPFRDMEALLQKVRDMGFAGVQNFPTVGLIDGKFRQNLEDTGMSFQKEVDMVRIAKDNFGLITTPYCFNVQEALDMANAGADIIVAHMGLTTGGSIGSGDSMTLDEAVTIIQSIADAASSVNPDVIVLCHGGPVSMPEDAEYVLKRTTGVHGFYGASSMERLPVETAITKQMQQFKNVKLS
mmetsp:Transcript_41056/g.60252  ORF Transcript_41056/g.60252 Transcript_41056/m.60252 type:complete len:725 (+) Transcript_41056:13-2187(+)|eukprot:CAMPEP_0195519356 /NCGR_PEP_ID=MMETSP0794_2-20130614/14596_1 /TAXON_ID=515487 /ORGANISM="Stephanopyxis turris, Strain CCMP 815" /LENGTH=724 /DNA_ID=CAMNT_0040648491 /DNA_START=12 /DNA_END=2186 /DNA_ORIENTATION=-